MQLLEPLHSVLLTMCEDQPHRRLPLQSVLEVCQVHREVANLHVKQLVGLVLGTISEVSADLCFPTREPLAMCGC